MVPPTQTEHTQLFLFHPKTAIKTLNVTAPYNVWYVIPTGHPVIS